MAKYKCNKCGNESEEAGECCGEPRQEVTEEAPAEEKSEETESEEKTE